MRVNVTLTGTKHPRYEWVVRFTEMGVRTPRYFKKGEKAIAKAFADRKRIELENVGVTAEQIGTEDRLVVAEFQDQLAHHGVTLRQALDLAMEHLTRRGRSQTVEQVYKRMLNNLEADGLSDAHAAILGAFAGLRPGEIERLDWSDIDLPRKVIRVAPRKSGRNAQRRSPRNRYVEIRPNLYEFLVKLENPINGPVYPFAKPSSTNIHYGRKLLRQMREKANVRQISDGLRHSYGTYLLALLDGDREKVADQMGNSRAVVDSNYRRPVLPEEAQAYWAIQPS